MPAASRIVGAISIPRTCSVTTVPFACDPGSVAHNLVAAALQSFGVRRATCGGRNVGVLFKSPAQARLGIQDGTADEGCGRESGVFHRLRQSWTVGRQRETGLIAHAGRVWPKARQNRAVRRQRQRRLRNILREADAIRRECVDRGRLDPAVAVAFQVVCAKGINGDENNAGGRGAVPAVSGTAGQQEPGADNAESSFYLAERPSVSH